LRQRPCCSSLQKKEPSSFLLPCRKRRLQGSFFFKELQQGRCLHALPSRQQCPSHHKTHSITHSPLTHSHSLTLNMPLEKHCVLTSFALTPQATIMFATHDCNQHLLLLSLCCCRCCCCCCCCRSVRQVISSTVRVWGAAHLNSRAGSSLTTPSDPHCSRHQRLKHTPAPDGTALAGHQHLQHTSSAWRHSA